MKIKFKNVFILTVVFSLIFSLFTAVVTNPKKDAYISWCTEQASAQTTNAIEKGIVSFLAGPLVKSSTNTKNYIIFTIYETSFSKEKMKVLGIFNNFIPIGKEEQSDINSKTQGA